MTTKNKVRPDPRQLTLNLKPSGLHKTMNDFAVLVNDARGRCTPAEWQDVMELYQSMELYYDESSQDHVILNVVVCIHAVTREVIEAPYFPWDKGHRFDRRVPGSNTMQAFADLVNEIRPPRVAHSFDPYLELWVEVDDSDPDPSMLVLALDLMVGRLNHGRNR